MKTSLHIHIFKSRKSIELKYQSTHRVGEIPIIRDLILQDLLVRKDLHGFEYEFFDDNWKKIEEREGVYDKEKECRLEKKKRNANFLENSR